MFRGIAWEAFPCVKVLYAIAQTTLSDTTSMSPAVEELTQVHQSCIDSASRYAVRPFAERNDSVANDRSCKSYPLNYTFKENLKCHF